MLDAGFDMQAGGLFPLTVLLLKDHYEDHIVDKQLIEEDEAPEPHHMSQSSLTFSSLMGLTFVSRC
jgi:hypothetical protein